MSQKSAVIVLILGLLLINACNQRLPEEERKAYKEEMEQRKIKQITPQQVFEFTESKMLEIRDSIISGDLIRGDDLFSVEKVLPSEQDGQQMQQLMEAYLFNLENGEPLPDNRQELENGDILYSLPVVTDSNGITSLKHLVNIRFNRKQVIREISSN